jgi:hypothetical protein
MRLLIVSLFIILASTQAVSQDTTGTIVILCDKIGPTIDLDERSIYKMFQSVQHFESAVLLQRPDSSYIFKVIEKIGDQLPSIIRWFPVTAQQVERIRNHIEPHSEMIVETPLRSRSSSSKVPVIKILGEFFVGGIGGIAGSFVLALIGAATIGPHNGEDPGLYGAIAGTIVGSTFGSSMGVYLIGNRRDERGSYWATLLGSTVGTVIFLALSQDPDDANFWIALYALPALGGTIGFNESRRHKMHPATSRAIINFKHGEIRAAFPEIYFTSDAFAGRNSIKNIDLVRVHF